MSNMLRDEKSPYLLQHSDNPVDWYPWCGAAFEKAEKEGKPVFLSIGYSTCHWCHVMAHESFEDSEIADVLNRNFIAVKVDREERPDVDAVYMSVCQAMTGSGGWPLTILMTPDKKPFFAGTYLPKRSVYGSVGLFELLTRAAALWNEDPDRKKLIESGERITAFLKSPSYTNMAEPSKDILSRGARELMQSYDSRWGGFGKAPKFPTPQNLLFLLEYSVLEHSTEARHAFEHTLSGMARGGIWDHIGGGFSRYSTDEKWLIPHFEKMLYDNALLAYTYLKAYQFTGAVIYRSVAEETIAYVLRELSDGEGGFFCGQDADSDGVEGKFYALTPREVLKELGEEDGRIFCDWFNITESGNFEGKNVPNLLKHETWPEKNEKIQELCLKMYRYRTQRAALHRDDKILTSWNSMMISALAKASAVCHNDSYLTAAKNTQKMIEKRLTGSDGRLYIRYRDGETAHKGQLDDYAYYAAALLELYQTTWEIRYLEKAVHIAEQMIRFFADRKNGGFFMYAEDAEQLISRPKEVYDGAVPSGNSVAANVLAALAPLTGEARWSHERDRQLCFLAGEIAGHPSSHCSALLAMCSVLYPSAELVCSSADANMPRDAERILHGNPPPNLSVLFQSPDNRSSLSALAPFTKEYAPPKQGTLYYLCSGNTCSAPIRDTAELRKILSSDGGRSEQR